MTQTQTVGSGVPGQGSYPLTKEHYESINALLTDLANLRNDLAKAGIAGLKVSERCEYCDHLENQLRQLKLGYFPQLP